MKVLPCKTLLDAIYCFLFLRKVTCDSAKDQPPTYHDLKLTFDKFTELVKQAGYKKKKLNVSGNCASNYYRFFDDKGKNGNAIFVKSFDKSDKSLATQFYSELAGIKALFRSDPEKKYPILRPVLILELKVCILIMYQTVDANAVTVSQILKDMRDDIYLSNRTGVTTIDERLTVSTLKLFGQKANRMLLLQFVIDYLNFIHSYMEIIKELKIVHNDINLGNIMVFYEGGKFQFILIDVGMLDDKPRAVGVLAMQHPLHAFLATVFVYHTDPETLLSRGKNAVQKHMYEKYLDTGYRAIEKMIKNLTDDATKSVSSYIRWCFDQCGIVPKGELPNKFTLEVKKTFWQDIERLSGISYKVSDLYCLKYIFADIINYFQQYIPIEINGTTDKLIPHLRELLSNDPSILAKTDIALSPIIPGCILTPYIPPEEVIYVVPSTPVSGASVASVASVASSVSAGSAEKIGSPCVGTAAGVEIGTSTGAGTGAGACLVTPPKPVRKSVSSLKKRTRCSYEDE